MPGGLQDMILFGIEAGGDTRALALIHATRVLVIVTSAPIILSVAYGAAVANPIGAPASEVPIPQLALMTAAALVGWRGGARIGLFGATILGPMALTAALSLAGLVEARPPREAILAAQFFIGAGIGVYFVGVTLADLKRAIAAGVGYVLMLAALSAIFASAVTALGLGRPMEAFLAFAPGGQAEMTLLAIVTGADLGYVIAHHIARLVLVIAGAPFAAALIRRGEPRD